MRVIGVHLGERPEQTSIAVTTWAWRTVTVDYVFTGATDARLIEMLRDPWIDVVGLDVPLGWPRAVIAPVEGSGRQTAIQPMARVTDDWLRQRVDPRDAGHNAAAARFDARALRAYDLLTNIPAYQVDRTGRRGRVVEVAPAAALRIWGLPSCGYEDGPRAIDIQIDIIRELATAVGSHPLDLDVENATELNALVASIVAGMTRTGLTEPVPDDHVESAIVEGWVHVPLPSSLQGLLTNPLRSVHADAIAHAS